MIGSGMWNEKKDQKKTDKNNIHHCFAHRSTDHTGSFYMDVIYLF